MLFAQLKPGGLYVKRTYRPDWELTLIRVGESPRLWRWNEKRWSYEVAEDADRPDLKQRVGYLAVAPPAAWPESDGVGGMLRRGIHRWARPMAALRSPLPDPSVTRVAWFDLPSRRGRGAVMDDLRSAGHRLPVHLTGGVPTVHP
ncbi:hypothetical protein [Streptomyces sp. NPDC002133]|uniref:hypothetical protein n=2 Tax=Streptomyces sp. NPDC002133 TaxID=3154409 RepID=UPI00331B73FB